MQELATAPVRLSQGLEYYKSGKAGISSGLMHSTIGGWAPGDIRVVAAFDIDRRKVGHRLEEAIFAKPNQAKIFQKVLPVSGTIVDMGPGSRRRGVPYGELP